MTAHTFTPKQGRKLPSDLVMALRNDKADGYSLKELARKYHISQSCISVYTRDLFEDNNGMRLYDTEEECREAAKEHLVSHSHLCPICRAAIIEGHRDRCVECYRDDKRKKSHFADNPDCPICNIKTHKKGTLYCLSHILARYECPNCQKIISKRSDNQSKQNKGNTLRRTNGQTYLRQYRDVSL